MDLFLSWSTERSKKLASIFNKWVTKVIPQLDVYYSPDDIQPGERWSDSIKGGLKGNPMGIFFVVEENIVQPWLNFEAGAISNQVGNTNVIPLLHDIDPSRITGPLTQFQAISYNKEDLRRLINLINANITDVRKIEQLILNDIFEKWYPDFEKQYETFKQENPSPDVKEISGTLDEDGQLSEILSILRSMERGKKKNKFLKRDYDPFVISNDAIYNSEFKRNDKIDYVVGKSDGNLFICYAKDFHTNNLKRISEIVSVLSNDLERLPTCQEIANESSLPIEYLEKYIRYEDLPF
ncbi:hypothetical protein [Enterococcus gallinarum]|uniref:hypothetical protein n=1 Tax=Enterococcus gallinarum TaxID=1353 RepID=UPI003DA4CF81